ncbi:prephenate dehydratase [Nocardioides acrostichi]|uniref:prephenate dehydratase n=1 Tax=Nocardioides acrostichi TaxID=2784339 RepID=A0A930UWY1_9ACTN|nr:prephenate dehydratase domain-containing protein [Nocardioides acrostichi]MBF4162388.1 prephenate dehydratase [Nocardioides acrostichi]
MSCVGYLGPAGTFTHAAALELAAAAELVPMPQQSAALAALAAGEVDGVVLPIDNSVNGVVLPTLDALLATPGATIVGDVTVAVTFVALRRPGGVPAEVVVSHPHALAQCADYVRDLGLPVRTSSSTAEACRDLAPHEIALAAPICADLYDLEVLATAVEDHSGAGTQFVHVTSEDSAAGAGEVTLLAVLPERNEPGGLIRVLEPLHDLGVNLVNLVTRPVPASGGRYLFLLWADGLAPEQFVDYRARLAESGVRCSHLGGISGHVRHGGDAGSGVVPRRLGAGS